jgi:hypothetical protein
MAKPGPKPSVLQDGNKECTIRILNCDSARGTMFCKRERNQRIVFERENEQLCKGRVNVMVSAHKAGKLAREQVASLTVSLTKNQETAKRAKDVDHTGTEIIKFLSLKSLKVSN